MERKDWLPKGIREKLFFEDGHVSIITDSVSEAHGSHRHQLDMYATMLCTAGSAELMVNNRRLRVERNDFLVCVPGSWVEEVGMDEDFNGCGFNLSHLFFEKMLNPPVGLWNAHVYFADHPIVHLSEEAAGLFTQYYDLIRSKLQTTQPLRHHQQVVSLLMQAFMYEFHETVQGCIDIDSVRFTSGDNLFKQFVELLTQQYPKPRSVTWYAEKLHVTPKYLSYVTKNCSGQTAFALIDRYVLEDVKRNLSRPDKSIKVIAMELDFPSISFFGKYVKKHLGVAPKYYRKQMEAEA